MACIDKRSYLTEEDARKELERIARRPRRKGSKLDRRLPTRAYLCPGCRRWHLSHSARSYEIPEWQGVEQQRARKPAPASLLNLPRISIRRAFAKGAGRNPGPAGPFPRWQSKQAARQLGREPGDLSLLTENESQA